VRAVLADVDAAPISEPLRATLKFLREVTRSSVTAEHVRALRAAGVTRGQIDDALAVCWAFNVINRLGDAFGFDVPGPEAFAAGAKMLLARGYK
jgi:alkylhydroperoxidase family enzyme